MDIKQAVRRAERLLETSRNTSGDAQRAVAVAAEAEAIMRKASAHKAKASADEILAGGGEMDSVDASANMKRDDPSRPPLKRNPVWAMQLATRLARLHNCEAKPIPCRKRGALVRFCGFEQDAHVAATTFDYLVGELIDACRAYQRAAPRSKVESDRYRRAWIEAVCSGLLEAQSEKMRNAEASPALRTLVLAKQQAVLDQFGVARQTKTLHRALYGAGN